MLRFDTKNYRSLKYYFLKQIEYILVFFLKKQLGVSL